jgi:hypothetical protein
MTETDQLATTKSKNSVEVVIRNPSETIQEVLLVNFYKEVKFSFSLTEKQSIVSSERMHPPGNSPRTHRISYALSIYLTWPRI